MASFLLLVVFVLLGGTDGIGDAESNHLSGDAVGDCPNEPLPDAIFEWKGPMTQPWETSESFVCDSVNTCYGLNLSQDVEQIKQLKPISVMPHDDVRLHVSGQTDKNVKVIRTFLVDEIGFGTCDHNSGQQLNWSPSSADQTDQQLFISVPHDRLRLGSNFLIGLVQKSDPDNSTIPSQPKVFDCSNGLRLNITVKLSNCHTTTPSSVPDASSTLHPLGNGSISCSSRGGRCVTDLHSTTFYCRCCNNSFNRKENCSPSSPSSPSSSSFSSASASPPVVSVSPTLLGLLKGIILNASSSAPPYDVTMAPETTSSSVSSSMLSSLSSSSPCKCESKSEEREGCQCSRLPSSTPNGTTTEALDAEAHTKSRCLPECSDASQCVATDNGTYACRCPDGRLDTDCDDGNGSDVCESNPCHHGICVSQPPGYQCYCIPGYGGDSCQTRYELMCNRDNVCKNGGTCYEGEEPETYRCDCPDGYSGQDCSTKRDLCLSNPCVHICLDYGAYHMCECNPGFTGHQCEVNVNECDSNPCHNGGRCHDFVAGYRCQCAAGFHGTHCEHHTMSEMTLFVSSHRPQLHSLSMVVGTLAGAVLIAMSVVLGCYCKVNGIYRVFVFGKKGYHMHYEEEPTPSSSGNAFLGSDNSHHTRTVERMIDGTESSREGRRGGSVGGSRGDDLREIYLDVSPLVDSCRYDIA